jgi:hypothetical protein
LADRHLLGGALAGSSWANWRTLLIAAMGEVLTDTERATFTKLTGRGHEPLRRVEEAAFVVGRRGGKSKAVATLAAYLAGLCDHHLVRGERGVVLCIAPDQRQAKITRDYCEAALTGSRILKQPFSGQPLPTGPRLENAALGLANRWKARTRPLRGRSLTGGAGGSGDLAAASASAPCG